MKLSVIIVNYNVQFFLAQCLNSALKALENVSGEIIVVDNASTDGSKEFFTNYAKTHPIQYHYLNENLGFSKGNNYGIQLSKGEYVLLLNPDTVVAEDTFKKVVDFMDNHPKAGGLGVNMIDGKGQFLPESKRGLPTPKVAFYKIFGLSALFKNSPKFGQYHLTYLPKNQTHTIDVLSGAFMLMRKEALNKVGLLDETFFMYGEDIDLSYRIQLGGYTNHYFSDTQIIHYKGESTKKSSINYVVIFYRAMVIFAKKHFAGQQASLYSAVINMAIYLRAFLAIINRIVSKSWLPILDFLLLVSAMYGITHFYEEFSHKTFPINVLRFDIPLFSALWVATLFFSGGYDNPQKVKNIVNGSFIGSLIVLLTYSLLSEDYRFSRAIILLTSVYSVLQFLGIRAVLHALPFGFVLGGPKRKRLLIIGNEAELNTVNQLLNNTTTEVAFKALVAPNNHTNVKYTEHFIPLNKLEDTIKLFKINELIFTAELLSYKQIIQLMNQLSSYNLEFKIIHQNNQVIIGSNSLNTQGELYSVLSNNSISKIYAKRNKRVFDLAVSLVFVFMSPYLLLHADGRFLLSSILDVVLHKKTWVGYDLSDKQWKFLPKIKSGVVSIKTQNQSEQANLWYAKNYSPLIDLKTLIQFLF